MTNQHQYIHMGSHIEVQEPAPKRLCLTTQVIEGDISLSQTNRRSLSDMLIKSDFIGLANETFTMSLDHRDSLLVDVILSLYQLETHDKDKLSADEWQAAVKGLLQTLIFGTTQSCSGGPSNPSSLDLACHLVLLLSRRLNQSMTQLVPNIIDVFISVYQMAIKHTDLSEMNVAFLESFEIIGETLEGSTLFLRVMRLINASLQSPSSHVRSKAFSLAGRWGSPALVPLGSGGTSLAELATFYTDDPDARVRERAFAAFLSWDERQLPLPLSLYQVICRGLSDDEEQVRMTCVRLLQAISVRFPNSVIADEVTGSPEGLRLADDAFSHLCGMVQDSSLRVRALAAALLGQMNQVGESYLLQTLDKKVMSDLRMKKSVHERSVENKAEWATGRQWAADAPMGDSPAAEDVSLVAMGACGAVIHGLEDEYREVRLASISSVLEMASRCSRFAIACQDFLVDMLTDDLEQVRLAGVNALCGVAQCVLLRHDQLTIVLGALQEGSATMRASLHSLLAESKLSSTNCLMPLVDGLLKNLSRYATDKDSIWRCAARIGERHSNFVALNFSALFNTHPYLSAPEPRLEDPAYITVLLLGIHAVAKQPGLAASLPDHVRRAHIYLREVLPHLTPQLNYLQNTDITSDHKNLISANGKTESPSLLASYLKVTLSRFQSALQGLSDDVTRGDEVGLLRHLSHDLGRVTSHVCQFLSHLGRSCVVAAEWSLSSSALLQSAVRHALRLVHCYSGLSSEDVALLSRFSLHLISLHSSPDAVSSFSLSTLAELSIFNSPTINIQRLQATMETISSDLELRFPAGFGQSLPVRADISPYDWNIQHIHICVRSPDGRLLQWNPPSSAWKKDSSLQKQRLVTQVILSAGQWSEAGHVQVWLAVDTPHLSLPITKPVKWKLLPQPFRRV